MVGFRCPVRNLKLEHVMFPRPSPVIEFSDPTNRCSTVQLHKSHVYGSCRKPKDARSFLFCPTGLLIALHCASVLVFDCSWLHRYQRLQLRKHGLGWANANARKVRANYHEIVGSLEVQSVCEGREARGIRNSITYMAAFGIRCHIIVTVHLVVRSFVFLQADGMYRKHFTVSWYSCSQDR